MRQKVVFMQGDSGEKGVARGVLPLTFIVDKDLISAQVGHPCEAISELARA